MGKRVLGWLRHHSWSLSDLLALAGVVATVAVAVIGPLRRGFRQSVRAGLMRAGRPERRYAAWFITRWGQYDNPYLADTEDLDLSSTYISLTFRDPDAEQETRTVATKALANRSAGNLIIEGAPGSGKSTLLKAYGVGALKMRRRALWSRQRPPDIPFFVQLRKFARDLDRPVGGLAKYLVDEILVSGVGMSPADANDFLQHVLTEDRALVMLDGLDEVTADRYPAVLEAVHKFSTDRNPARPTHRARLVITCRRQNFLAIRDEWVPVIAKTVCTLAPLRNSEIFGYLDKLRTKFKTSGGPENFFQAVRASGTLDLHRVPLILAMSVGLYARRDYFDIPNSISKLYQTMIEEMLDRQRFKRDPGGGALAFQVDDKLRYLREFALASALGPDGFNEFGRKDLDAFARELAPDLNAVTAPEAFVTEIVDRSGLLSDVSEAGRFVFAHRSIQEYLAAEELRLVPDGATTLLGRAVDAEWRQVVLFYATAQKQRSTDVFLRELAARYVTLAAHCLAGAKASDEVAATILDSLHTADPVHLAALVAATMSPRQAVREMAIHRLEAQLLESMGAASSAFGGDVDGMLPLLGSLAGSNAARIAALVPRIVSDIPDDPRLVEPLWRCLAVPGIEAQPVCRTIVERLLTIAMDQDGFDELQKQEPYTRAFLTDAVRRTAYPFTRGLPMDSNLVTLLAWADYLTVTPAQPNVFFDAKANGRLARVETDRRRTFGFSFCWPGRIMTGAATILSVIAAVVVLATDWRVLLRPFGWWSPVASFAAAVVAFGIFIGLGLRARVSPEGSVRRRYLGVDAGGERGHVAELPREGVYGYSVLFGGPLMYAIAVPPLAAGSLAGYLIVAILGPFILFWLPVFDLFASTTRFYLYRPNPYIDMYDDLRSRPWLVRTTGELVTVEPTQEPSSVSS